MSGKWDHEQAEEGCPGRCRVHGWRKEKNTNLGLGGWQRRGREPLSNLYLGSFKTWNQHYCYCLCWPEKLVL